MDESSHKDHPADDYYARSALIYESYARQLGVKEETINPMKTLITDSCKPMHLCSQRGEHKSKIKALLRFVNYYA